MGGVFISYRREDSQGSTGRVADRLHQILGDDVPLFVDIDSIRPGQDFREVITETLAQCDVTLVMIGPRWATVTDDDGEIRLADPDDLHRLEVESSLASSATTIPVLVEGATMPAPEDLPESIRDLAYRHAAEVSVRRFAADAQYLADLIRAELTEPSERGAPPPEAPAPEPPPAPSAPTTEPVAVAPEPAEPDPVGIDPPADESGRSRLPVDPRILVGGLVALLVVIVVVVVAMTGDDDGGGTTAGDTDTTTPDTASPPADEISVFDLSVGDCFDAVTGTPVFTVALEPCSGLHHNEVFSIWSSFSPTQPNETTLLGGCESRFEGAVGTPYAASIYWIAGFWPDAAAWADGSRTVICYGYVRDGEGVSIETTGSMLDSGN